MSTAGGFAQPPQLEPVGISETPVLLRGVPASVEVTVDERAASSFLQARGESAPSRVLIELDDITGEEDPGTVYGVYLNLPDGAATAVVEAHHAASLSFFGIDRAANPVGDEPPHALSLTRDVSALLEQLAAGGEWDGTHMTVTFRPLGLVPPDQPDLAHALPEGISDNEPLVTVGSVRILYG